MEPAKNIGQEVFSDGFLRELIELAKRRRELLSKLRAALEANDRELSISIAKELVGIEFDRRKN